jgi:hypothetical protein
MKKVLLVLALCLAAVPMFGQASSFQGTCSGISFGYGSGGSGAMLNAWCLQSNGVAHQTSLAIRGIGNSNGSLVASGTGASTFQQSCGNITITANASGATLSALCRTSSGAINSSSVALTGIKNNNGNLTY